MGLRAPRRIREGGQAELGGVRNSNSHQGQGNGTSCLPPFTGFCPSHPC